MIWVIDSDSSKQTVGSWRQGWSCTWVFVCPWPITLSDTGPQLLMLKQGHLWVLVSTINFSTCEKECGLCGAKRRETDKSKGPRIKRLCKISFFFTIDFSTCEKECWGTDKKAKDLGCAKYLPLLRSLPLLFEILVAGITIDFSTCEKECWAVWGKIEGKQTKGKET